MADCPEKKLVEAVLRQAVKDYVKLNPKSSLYSAEFNEDEGKDFKTAEDLIFNRSSIKFGDWDLTFDEICLLLDLNPKTLKKFIFKNQIDF